MKKQNIRKPAIEELVSYITLGDNLINNNEEVLNLPEIYHYTSPSGFKSIIENSKIWLTDSRFLNDIEEQHNISNTIKQILGKKDIKFKKDIIEILEKYTDKDCLIQLFNKKRRFIFSSSQNKDELSLWNYYTKQNNYIGYSIGLIPKKLFNLMKVNNDDIINMYKCVYKEAEKEAHILDSITKAEKALNAKAFEHKQKEFVLEFLEECLYISSIIFKNEKFLNEQEIRLIYEQKESNFGSKLNIQYRLNNGIMIPYIEIDVNMKDIISSITIGPGNQEDIVLVGAQEFLIKNGIYIKSENIQSSIIPLRKSWNL